MPKHLWAFSLADLGLNMLGKIYAKKVGSVGIWLGLKTKCILNFI
jgi:hypothetical protein